MRIFSLIIFLFLLLLLPFMLSCEEDMDTRDTMSNPFAGERLTEPTDILARIMDEYSDFGVGAVYFSEAEEYSRGWLDSDLACFMYSGSHGRLSDLCRANKYAVWLSSGTDIFEVHVFESASPEDTTDIENMFLKRIEFMQVADRELNGYEAYQTSNSLKAQIYTCGRYVFLLATDDNGRAIDVIDKYV